MVIECKPTGMIWSTNNNNLLSKISDYDPVTYARARLDYRVFRQPNLRTGLRFAAKSRVTYGSQLGTSIDRRERVSRRPFARRRRWFPSHVRRSTGSPRVPDRGHPLTVIHQDLIRARRCRDTTKRAPGEGEGEREDAVRCARVTIEKSTRQKHDGRPPRPRARHRVKINPKSRGREHTRARVENNIIVVNVVVGGGGEADAAFCRSRAR